MMPTKESVSDPIMILYGDSRTMKIVDCEPWERAKGGEYNLRLSAARLLPPHISKTTRIGSRAKARVIRSSGGKRARAESKHSLSLYGPRLV
jgi:hypothetical protein